MSVLDLNLPQDFAALTTALGLGATEPSKWNIVEASFDSVIFHIFSSKPDGAYGAGVPQVVDRGGQRIVAYEFPFKDGQTTGTLGTKANSFEFDVVIHGPDYLKAYNRLITAGDKKTPGLLMHPVLGAFRCRMVDHESIHQSDAHQAIRMRLSFVEHSYTLAVSSQVNPAGTQTPLTKSSTLKQALVAAVSVFQALNAARLTVLAYKAAVTSVVNGIGAQISNLKDSYAALLRDIATTFGGADSVNFGTDLPGILPVQLGGAGTANGGTQSDVYPLVDQQQTPFAEVPTAVVNQELPVAVAAIQAAQAVNLVRLQAETIIAQLSALDSGQGAVDFYDEILSLKQSAVTLQQVLELALSSSNAIVTSYTTPRLMSIREVAFAIGLTPDDSEQIELLNPELLSVNYIPAGTVLKVPAL